MFETKVIFIHKISVHNIVSQGLSFSKSQEYFLTLCFGLFKIKFKKIFKKQFLLLLFSSKICKTAFKAEVYLFINNSL